MYGKTKALELWHQHGLSVPIDLRRLVGELGLEVVAFPLNGRLKEVIIDGIIGVRPGMPRPWFRWCIAHAIGHHTLHVGTSLYLESWQWAVQSKAERQAEEFAAWLLCGPNWLQFSAHELGVPHEKLAFMKNLNARVSTAPRPLVRNDIRA